MGFEPNLRQVGCFFLCTFPCNYICEDGEGIRIPGQRDFTLLVGEVN